ncbi:hypothetical protein Plhal710r2_c022g0091211 [Plasmopara halstedii]
MFSFENVINELKKLLRGFLIQQNVEDKTGLPFDSFISKTHDAIEKWENAVDSSVDKVFDKIEVSVDKIKKAAGPSVESSVSDIDNGLEELENILRGKEAVHGEQLSSNGGQHSLSSVKRDGIASRNDLSSVGYINGINNVKLMTSMEASALKQELTKLLRMIPRSAEGQDDDSSIRRLFEEMLPLIWQLHILKDNYGELVFIGMLRHPTLGELAHKQWYKAKVTVDEAREILMRYSTTEDLFYRNELGSLWLSYIAYYSKQAHEDFPAELILRHFEVFELTEDEIVKFLLNDQRTQRLAYRMEKDGYDGLSHFANTFTGNSLSHTWFFYAAFALERGIIDEDDIANAMFVFQSHDYKTQLKIFTKMMTDFKPVKKPLSDVGISGKHVKLNEEEIVAESSKSQNLLKASIHEMAKKMVEHLMVTIQRFITRRPNQFECIEGYRCFTNIFLIDIYY